ncbi:MAG: hypothetical protein F4X64_08405 [Chloroflexi bacterium]|nr:hypothetical protein [Chloroflexota bacterium]
MNNYKAAFRAFAAGFSAAFAAGYADVAPGRERVWREWRERDEIEAAMFDDEPSDIGYGPGQWYEDEGEWVQVPEDPWVESARRRAEEARERRGYGAWVAEGKARFEATRTLKNNLDPKDFSLHWISADRKQAREDFSLDLLSAFAAAYVIGSGGWANFHDVLSDEDLYDAAGVPPDAKATILAAYQAYRALAEKGLTNDEDAEEKSYSAKDFGFVGPSSPVGPLSSNLYDSGHDTGLLHAYREAYRVAMEAIEGVCDDNDDMAQRVMSAVREALSSSYESERRKERSLLRGTRWPNAPRIE